MKDHIDNHYLEAFSLNEFENMLRINKYRLCREFSKYFCDPPLRYLNKHRINLAKKILLTTDLPISEVSRMVGYENVNHFINLFKTSEQITPLTFKQKALNSQSVLHCPY
ncbi:helix-turn-helix domain-containing protein [Anaerocolumna jejuensis]|uniref:helix-turn-helix domain-containing protein n=1 Tax=Anaerocolumna jejuensis TaxID=259063 RepID=UPI003F7CC2ED